MESGLGWIPYYLTRLDTMADRHGWEQLGMNLPELPELLLAPEHVRHLRGGRVRRARTATTSASRTCAGPPTTRTPTATWPESQQVIHTHFDDVPVEEMRLMVGGNAARIYNL